MTAVLSGEEVKMGMRVMTMEMIIFFSFVIQDGLMMMRIIIRTR